MYHIDITDTRDSTTKIEFTHHDFVAPAHYWNKAEICLDHIKINFFIEGDLYVFVNNNCYSPLYGDIHILPPGQIHCGNILKSNHINYYQLDIGIHAFSQIPEGDALLKQLIQNGYDHQNSLRPQKDEIRNLARLFQKMEHLIGQNNKSLSFATAIEIVCLINQIGQNTRSTPHSILSKTTSDIIHYIEQHYSEKIRLQDLADRYEVSTTYLSQLFKKEVGFGIHAYLTEYRIMQATYLLKTHSIAETCYLCGFCDSSHFIAAFKKRLDMTPASYKKKINTLKKERR